MSGWDPDAFDRWLTTDPVNQPDYRDDIEPIYYIECCEGAGEIPVYVGTESECSVCHSVFIGKPGVIIPDE